jgi:outer membrane protein assembly factor BamB
MIRRRNLSAARTEHPTEDPERSIFDGRPSAASLIPFLAVMCCLLVPQEAWAQWAFGVGGTNWESGRALAVTSNDEVVVTGWSTDVADWDPSESAEAFVRTGSGFVARYGADGSLVWVRGLHGIGYGVAIDDAGEIFVVDGECWLRRFSPEGEERWAVELDPPSQSCTHVALAGSDFLYVAGEDGYLARVNPENGDALWSHRLGSGSDTVEGLAAHESGGVTMAGYFYTDFDADPGAEEHVLTVNSPPDGFIASYDSEGNYRWSRLLSASEFENIGRAAMDETGAFYLTGNFTATMDFGSGPVTGSGSASFVAKYSAPGEHVWTRTASGGGVGRSISVREGLVVVAGNNYAEINFHPARLASEDLTERGIFVAQFDTAGTYQWVRGLTVFASVPWTIGLDAMGGLYLSGMHWTAIDFDPGPELFEVRNYGEPRPSDLPNFFLARYGPGGTFSVATDIRASAPPSSIRLSPPYPHPVRGHATFSLRLDHPQAIRLVLTDVLGRRVRIIADGYFQAATHEFAADLTGLPAGLYVVHIQGQRAVSQTIVIQ